MGQFGEYVNTASRAEYVAIHAGTPTGVLLWVWAFSRTIWYERFPKSAPIAPGRNEPPFGYVSHTVVLFIFPWDRLQSASAPGSATVARMNCDTRLWPVFCTYWDRPKMSNNGCLTAGALSDLDRMVKNDPADLPGIEVSRFRLLFLSQIKMFCFL